MGERVLNVCERLCMYSSLKKPITVQEIVFNFFNEVCCSDVCHSFHPSLSNRKMPRTQLRGSV